MKKILLCLLMITLFTLTGCGSVKESERVNRDETNKKENANSVVLYFSATGTTKKVAEKIASKSNSDIIEIIPKTKIY